MASPRRLYLSPSRRLVKYDGAGRALDCSVSFEDGYFDCGERSSSDKSPAERRCLLSWLLPLIHQPFPTPLATEPFVKCPGYNWPLQLHEKTGSADRDSCYTWGKKRSHIQTKTRAA